MLTVDIFDSAVSKITSGTFAKAEELAHATSGGGLFHLHRLHIHVFTSKSKLKTFLLHLPQPTFSKNSPGAFKIL